MANSPTLTPVTSPWMHDLMRENHLLYELLEKHGSPINIHYMDAMDQNFLSFQQVFEEVGIKYKMFFARKANKTKAAVSKASELGMGIDTASYQEYIQCIEMGINPSDLIITAAVKTRELVEKAVLNGSVLLIDNEDECDLVQEMAVKVNREAKIGFRLSGFFFKERKLNSRFGFDLLEIDRFVTKNFLQSKKYSQLLYKGLHFHLNGYSTEERAYALAQTLAFAQLLAKKGLRTEFIDIGGGFLVNYLQDKIEWDYFNLSLRKAISGIIPPITYNNDGLGLELYGGILHGELKTYPFWNTQPKESFLRQILSHKNQKQQTLAEVAAQEEIEIRMEPGRSMLDQTGLTLARVAFRKRDSIGDWLVGLEMNMTQMLSGSADFLLDPYVLYQRKEEGEPVEVFFTGAYCLERDILLKRKIRLPKLPHIGDMVVFVNTAGYMMHFFESSAHLFPLATNLIWNRETKNNGIEIAHFQNDEDL
ncbi:Y4yA family PLP-dependent enzyme [Algoriphagus sp. AGSA1]|uniref:Y4yA family PLP-dependent enzyme n=1 Tax=Algoriphagus sp. AGSA1 TaxID=2907213 RepID=UPI001F478EAA|nr:Y4yA family PLP-dependent enzyme [Algoriphagus sp. AGSA1]MCE7053601.1 Y4yA family PLP-dependent enzyme [Algoriphagus sp. AGSA1]